MYKITYTRELFRHIKCADERVTCKNKIDLTRDKTEVEFDF